MVKEVTYQTGLEIYEQCEQIIHSYGPPVDENMPTDLINTIQYFKKLYKRDYEPRDQ